MELTLKLRSPKLRLVASIIAVPACVMRQQRPPITTLKSTAGREGWSDACGLRLY